MPAQQITGSVGRRGTNIAADVIKVQTLLKSKGFYQGNVDRICGPKTIAAIEKFQAHFMRTPDALINSSGITWKKLTGQSPMVSTLPAQSAAAISPDFSFPFSFIPPESWRSGSRAFGVSRSGGRRHAGCDLYAPLGTPIYAVADGELVRDPYYFTVVPSNPNQVQALEVRHGGLLVRYAEIKPHSFTGIIKKGQKLAEVGSISFPTGTVLQMLHIEIYTNGASTAPLTDLNRPPYRRRADLTDPTPYLDEWVNNLAQP